MSSTHSPHLLFSPKKKSNSNENNHSFSYEVISTLESTGVHFRTSIDPGSYVPAHLHHAIEIIYLLEGNLTVIMESSVREYHAGECILINSDIIHSTKCTSPNKAILFQIPLSFLSLYLPDADQLVFNLENPEEGAPEAESPEGENSQTAMVMTQVRRYLEDNYMFDLSLDSVGEILHISPAYLSAQFKKYQKMNFLDCLTELRINAAKELLADPFRSSAEVASMVGYEDASYFARAFKKRTGMTPTQYRRQAGKKSAEAHL